MNSPQVIIKKTLEFIAQKKHIISGRDYIKDIAKYLGDLLEVDYVLISKYPIETSLTLETEVIYSKEGFVPNIIYDLAHSPCEKVMDQTLRVYPENVQRLFPKDELLVQMDVESYMGLPLWNSMMEPIGLIAILHGKSLIKEDIETIEILLQIIAIKVSVIFEKEVHENQIKKQETESIKLSQAVEQSANSIIITNLEGEIEYTNPKFTDLTGYTAEEVLGENPKILSSGNQSKEFYTKMWKTIINGEIWRGRFLNKAKNGSLFWEQVTISPIKNDQGKIINFLAIKEDITEKKNAEEKLIEAKKNIEKSEKLYRNLVHVIPDGIYKSTSDGDLIEVNPSMVEMLGYDSKEELLAIDIKSDLYFDIEDRESVELKENKEELGIYRLKRKDGSEIWVEDHGWLTKDEKKPIVYHEGVMRDITDRIYSERLLQEKSAQVDVKNKELRKAKEKAEKSEIKFKSMVDTSPLAIFMTSGDLQVADYINPTFFNLFGYAFEDVNIVDNWMVLAYPDKAYRKIVVQEWKEKVETAISNNSNIAPMETIVECKNGSKKNIKWGFISTKAQNWAFGLDMTETRKFEKELFISKEKAEESNRLKTEFLNNMSHEIRTPMNGILGFSDLLNDPDLSNEKRINFIKIIQSCGAQLLHIIDDILEISSLGTKQVKVIEEQVCLNDALLELFSIFDIKSKENKTPLYFKKGLLDRQSTILTDKTKLNKVISNLLENSLKFTNQGYIEFGYQLINNELELYVKDTGIGIEKSKHDSIFERFSQAEKDLSKKIGGLGLGLSIAKENTELLGGRIQLKSEKGKGATFFVTIPYKPVYKATDTDRSNAEPKYTVLIAEDDEVNYLYLEILLKKVIELDCEIIHVINGQEAIDACKKNKTIDLVLMDLKMPVLNGFDATKLIKKHCPKVPIIAQTSYSTLQDKEKAILAGCDDFISKPISKEVISQVLKKYSIINNDN